MPPPDGPRAASRDKDTDPDRGLPVSLERRRSFGSQHNPDALLELGAAHPAFVVGFPGAMIAVALTIAGSDSSGGAGIQADLKSFAAFAVFCTSAITAITAQNTRGVNAIANLDPAFVAAQIDAVADDFTIAAAKTGMLSRTEIISAVADRIRIRKIPNVVVDPVMVAASGDVLLEPDAIAMMRDVMLRCDVSNRDGIRDAARALVALGVRSALVKGGCA
jgi:Phosphomethylpyrimidine kinase